MNPRAGFSPRTHCLTFKCLRDQRHEKINLGACSGYHLATIYANIPMVECAIVDGKTAQPNWNSLKN